MVTSAARRTHVEITSNLAATSAVADTDIGGIITSAAARGKEPPDLARTGIGTHPPMPHPAGVNDFVRTGGPSEGPSPPTAGCGRRSDGNRANPEKHRSEKPAGAS